MQKILERSFNRDGIRAPTGASAAATAGITANNNIFRKDIESIQESVEYNGT